MKGNLNEQCREAIKNSDADGVKQLLVAGADAKYVDAQNNSLVHMAAMFNVVKIVEMLHENGADMETKNGQGETPMDLAPPALQFKMKKMLGKE
jgi:ankyrin repeat protein